MKKAKLKTGDKDNIIVLLKNKNYNDYKQSIDSNVQFFDGDRSESKWNIIQFENGVIHWWNSEEIEYSV